MGRGGEPHDDAGRVARLEQAERVSWRAAGRDRAAAVAPAAHLGAGDERRVLAAIRAAEAATSGEIRVHLRPHCRGDVAAAARRLFERLGMTRTERRNGVLIFVAFRDRAFAILGDRGIDAAVPHGFWESTAAAMSAHFARGDLAGGLEAGVREAGQALAAHFPRQPDDVNELTDDVHYG